MPVRDIYLQIEPVYEYSPVEPDPMPPPPVQYRRDCMRNPGHEDGTIPASEVEARRLTALIYREYLDPGYLVPKPDKIVLADVNEPPFHRRVPGTVIYAQPGDRLRVHVRNVDTMPHSLHMHGLRYGIDSDGSWPLGTQSSDGRRSDEICPGDSWTYTFDVEADMVGAWPFHDHWRHVAESINRGLFGGVVVLPRGAQHLPKPVKLPPGLAKKLKEPVPPAPGPPVTVGPHGRGGRGPHGGGPLGPVPPGPHGGGPAGPHGGGPPSDIRAHIEFLKELVHLPYFHPTPRPRDLLHVPLFFHFMTEAGGDPAFDSPDLNPAAPPFEVDFGAPGVFAYHCRFHPSMRARVRVVPGASSLEIVEIQDLPVQRFFPDDVSVRPGGKVRWVHAGNQKHSVTEDGATVPSYCFNGRSFVGNTPTILAAPGQRIRWYVFNLDLGMNWHNFHPHAQRWNFASDPVDARSLGPAESFVVETVSPPALLLPEDIAKKQGEKHRPRHATAYEVCGDFLFHCHVEMHMMEGMTGLVRSRQTVWLTPEQHERVMAETGLPECTDNLCPSIDPDRCMAHGVGTVEEIPGPPEVFLMHSCLLPQTGTVLYWGYTRTDQARLLDLGPPAAISSPANQPADVSPNAADPSTWDIWSAEHAFLDDANGTLLVHGGFAYDEAFLFDPATSTWSLTGSTANDRFYATTFTLADGKALTLFGNAATIEVYDPGTGTWSAPKPLPATFNYLFYPWAYLLPGGELFIAGPQQVTRRFDWTATPIVDDPAETWNAASDRGYIGGSQQGTSVLLPLRPPQHEARVLNAGGAVPGTEDTAEMIDLSSPTPSWQPVPNMKRRRNELTSVLLPDGRVFVCGGMVDAVPDGGPIELFDPEDPGAGWTLGPTLAYGRRYHSSAILLADGSVLVGGDDPSDPGRPRPHERYLPGYFAEPRPTIANAPATVSYGAMFTVQSPDATTIAEVVLMRPGAVTHGFNMSQRFVGCDFTGAAAGSLDVEAPPDGTVAPPGHYLLFVVDGNRVPSEGRWIRLTP
jgi:FtsP/CotA-like multicopper oxidase with cupredoxin domain